MHIRRRAFPNVMSFIKSRGKNTDQVLKERVKRVAPDGVATAIVSF